TPHYKNYYGKKSGSKLPDDTENPVPIHFLTVKPGSVFAFYFCLRPQIISQKTEKDYWKKRIKELIVETGQNYGFGAKTASGYGYFEPVEEKS
ncbi:MAG TPA: type III-B CRISPR module RAMP protein Cmr6, partial [bacterium]|nr:type III-B CRISPR module RAMP protein Cmr6 [bacterium]